MTDSEEDFEIENKNHSKRFKRNLEDFKIKKSDFDEKVHVDKEENIHDLSINNKNFDNDREKVNGFEDNPTLLDNEKDRIDGFEDDLIFKGNKKDFKDSNNENVYQELLFSEENENIHEELQLSSKIKETISKDSKRKFPILPILGLAIGILFIMIGTLVFLGNSDKVVDNVISGENSVLSVFIGFIGVIFISLSLLKIFSSRNPFGNVFNVIKDFESEDQGNVEVELKDYNNIKVESEDHESTEDNTNEIDPKS
jgi:hypothetical protein